MEHLPIEISEQIYTFACTDDGKTGRSLSLVSRRIHHTSKPFKFRSIAIDGVEQAVAFALLLQSIPPHLRNVVYLAIANNKHRRRPKPPTPTPILRRISRVVSESIFGAIRTRARPLQDDSHTRNRRFIRNMDKTLFDAVFYILTTIASTIRHLDIHYKSECSFANTGIASFPVLPVLTSLRLDCPSSCHVETLPQLEALFPSLKYLNVANYRIYNAWIDSGGKYITKQMPSLTHLKISVDLVRDIESAKSFRQDHRKIDITSELPVTIERVFISGVDKRSYMSIHFGGDVIEVDLYKPTLDRCRELASEDDRVVIMEMGDSEMEEFHPLRYRY